MFKQDEAMLRLAAMPLDHLFIQEYLPQAKGDYVKVYIYGLYLSQHPVPDMGLEEMARELGMETSEVEAALRYWERRRLVRRMRDDPPEYQFRGAAQLAAAGEEAIEADAPFVAFSEDVYALFGDRRKVRPADIALCWEWVQDMGLPQETVMMLLSHLIATRGINFTFRSAQAEAVRMKEEGVASAEDAESYFSHSRSVQDNARQVLRQLGKRRAPSQNEMDLYRKWTEEWGYDPGAILAACQETTKGEPTFAYLDGILKGIRARAEKTGGAPRTGEALQSQLAAESEQNQALREFSRLMNRGKSTLSLEKPFQRLCDQYGQEIVLLAARETAQVGGDLEKLEYALERMRAQGIATLADAQAYFEEIHRQNLALQPLFEACGRQSSPTVGDRTLYRKWLGWGFSQEMLLLAAGQARGASRPMPYMDKILDSWRAAGITTPAQAAAQQPPAVSGGKRVSAQQYAQRDYTEEELEKKIGKL